MPGKKRPSKPPGDGPVMVILEEIRSQNRATLEAVEAHREEFRRELQDLHTETRGEMGMLRSAAQGIAADVQHIKAEVAALKEQAARIDAVITADYRERLQRLEERVAAIERRSA